jgi:hypothetical protein
MKAIERLIFRRKLASLRSAFPHDDDTTVLNIANIYMDIMEFSRSIIIYFSTRNAYRNSSRPGLYPESVARDAWKLLLLQIGSGATSHLIQALGKLRTVDVHTFLSTLVITCLNDVENL